jgi:hypothetical protein
MSLAVGLDRQCCKLDDKGARCRPSCVLAALEPGRIQAFLGMLARRLEIERRARHDPQDAQEARELLEEIKQQITALEALK